MKLPFKVDLSEKVAVITGGGGVICSGFAAALAACGCRVALLDINEEAAKKAAAEAGGECIAVKCDCLDKQSLFAAKETVLQKFEKIDILINGTGGNNPRATTDNEYMTPDTVGKDFFSLDASGLKFVFDLNITSAFLTTQVFAQDMLETGGNIINLSSMNAFHPLTKIPAYSAAKAGVIGLTKALAKEVGPSGVRVNAVSPGVVMTDMMAGFSDEDVAALKEETPLIQLGMPEDIADAVIFLASEKARFITGQVLSVNGGMVI